MTSERDEQRQVSYEQYLEEDAPVALFELSPDGTVLSANLRARSIIAGTAKEGSLVDFVASGHGGILRDHLAAVFSERSEQSCRLRALPSAGGGTYLVRTAPAPGDPDRCRSAWFLLDPDGEEARLRARLAVAEKGVREGAVFLARFSHEVRSALASMVGFADLLRDEIPDEQRELADSIRLSGRHLLDTLAAVMDVASQGIRSADERVPVDLAARVRERAQALGPLARKKGLRFDVLGGEDPVIVTAHPTLLDRVLHNLIDNAIKYTPSGRVEVSVESRDGSGWIYVADTGLGIDRSFLPRLFTPFEREGRGAAADGSGLGLTITKQLVEGMGGRIYVCSVRDEGSTFTVTLPLAAQR